MNPRRRRHQRMRRRHRKLHAEIDSLLTWADVEVSLKLAGETFVGFDLAPLNVVTGEYERDETVITLTGVELDELVGAQADIEGEGSFDPIAALLDFAVDAEQTPEEAEQELREMGVDVDAFLARVRERRAREAEPVHRRPSDAARLRARPKRVAEIKSAPLRFEPVMGAPLPPRGWKGRR